MSDAGGPGNVPNVPSPGRRVLSGSLDEVDIFSIAQFLVIQRKTGGLTIVREGVRGALIFENGQIINGSVPGASEGMEAVRKIFKWKAGSFEFAPGAHKVPAVIATDAQSLLMDLAIEADEMSRIIPPSELAAPPVTAPPNGAPVVRPAVVRVVRPGAPPAPPLAAGVGSLPPGGVASQPLYQRKPFSQEEFVRSIEERLVIADTELPEPPRHSFRHAQPKAGPSPSLVLLLAVGVPVVLVLAGTIAWVVTKTAAPVASLPPRPTTPAASAPVVAKPHQFITKPGSPAYAVEKCIADIPLRCDLGAIDLDRKDVRQLSIRLVREVAWDKNDLAMAIASDSIALVRRVFDTQSYVDRIYIVAQSHLDRELGQTKLDDAFRMTAERSVYMKMKDTYEQMSPARIIDCFGGRFDQRLAGQ